MRRRRNFRKGRSNPKSRARRAKRGMLKQKIGIRL